MPFVRTQGKVARQSCLVLPVESYFFDSNAVCLKIVVNREVRNVVAPLSLAALLQELGVDTPTGIAVAVNNEVIARGDWSDFQLSENDKLTIITATQGG